MSPKHNNIACIEWLLYVFSVAFSYGFAFGGENDLV